MNEYDIQLVKRKLFDRIEDASDLTQANRIWLLNTIDGLTVTFLIRDYIMTNNCYEELGDVMELQVDEVVDYVFHNYIKM